MLIAATVNTQETLANVTLPKLDTETPTAPPPAPVKTPAPAEPQTRPDIPPAPAREPCRHEPTPGPCKF